MNMCAPALRNIMFTSVIALACGNPAFAQIPAGEAPATFAADEMTHDKELGTITARGHVEVNHDGRTLLADTISYDQNNDIIRATGNVTLHRPNGDVLFANMMEISGDLKNGVIENFRAVLSDKSRFAASRAELINDETLTLDRGVYSPCQPCQDDPTRPLLWQLKAVKVTQDKVNKVVEYKHAWLELAGVPVLYTPYLSHPDPSVKRKSGFLPPSVGASSDLGTMVQAPYFYVIDDYSDATITPIVTTKENGGLAGQYRERYTKGEINADGSLVVDGNSDANGHIDGSARFNIDPTWRWGVDAQRTSTDTYMRRYGFGHHNTLTSQVYVEGFRDNNYANFQAITYQGLRATDDSKTTPLVLPIVEYNHQGDAGRYGGYNTLDVNLTMLTRDQGADSQRVSIKPTWNLPYIAPKGDIYKLSASLGVDFFHVQDLSAPSAYNSVLNGVYNGAALRITPEVAFDWSWPMARRNGSVTEVLEPIGQVVVSPYGGNSFKMPNEDSQDFDFSDTNLFSTNRFTGYDRVESGPRANYGLKWGVYGDGGGSTSILIGQSYRLKDDDTFDVGSGLENNASDYVARMSVSPGKHLNLLYRTRVDQKTLDFNRNEVGMNGAYSIFKYYANYVFFGQQPDSEFPGRREISYSLGADLTDTWSTSFSGVRDLSEDGGQRSMRFGAVYDDECFTFNANLSRTFYFDREIKPTDAVMFQLVFKTLGQFTTPSLNPSGL